MAKVCSIAQAQQMGVFADACIAFGVFDGYHRGHRFLIGESIDYAKRQGLTSVILTFDHDPDELFRADQLKKLCSNEERISMLASTQADYVVVLAFTPQFAALEPLAFLERAFLQEPPHSIHVGFDFRFGRKGSGTVDDMRFWAERTGTEVFPYQLEQYDGAPVTSTRIRNLLANGNVAQAAYLLERPYRFSGTVEHGRGQGRQMGFCTANLSVPSWRCMPGPGVYAGYATVKGTRYKAALSVGVSPTFANAVCACEVHLLDFEGDLYGGEVAVDLIGYLRPMKKFERVEDLIATVNADFDWVRKNLD